MAGNLHAPSKTRCLFVYCNKQLFCGPLIWCRITWVPGEPVLSQWRDLSPVSTTRVDGLLTRAVNSGSGNRALLEQPLDFYKPDVWILVWICNQEIARWTYTFWFWFCCPTSSNPALLPSCMVVCLSFTLLMMLLLPCWPITGLNRICKKKWCDVGPCLHCL